MMAEQCQGSSSPYLSKAEGVARARELQRLRVGKQAEKKKVMNRSKQKSKKKTYNQLPSSLEVRSEISKLENMLLEVDARENIKENYIFKEPKPNLASTQVCHWDQNVYVLPEFSVLRHERHMNYDPSKINHSNLIYPAMQTSSEAADVKIESYCEGCLLVHPPDDSCTTSDCEGLIAETAMPHVTSYSMDVLRSEDEEILLVDPENVQSDSACENLIDEYQLSTALDWMYDRDSASCSKFAKDPNICAEIASNYSTQIEFTNIRNLKDLLRMGFTHEEIETIKVVKSSVEHPSRLFILMDAEEDIIVDAFSKCRISKELNSDDTAAFMLDLVDDLASLSVSVAESNPRKNSNSSKSFNCNDGSRLNVEISSEDASKIPDLTIEKPEIVEKSLDFGPILEDDEQMNTNRKKRKFFCRWRGCPYMCYNKANRLAHEKRSSIPFHGNQ